MTSAGTPLRRSARPGWYGSGSPMRVRAGPSVLASWTAPSASASHSRGLASDEDWAGTCRLKRTLAPGILSLARLSMAFRISAEREGSDSPGLRPVVHLRRGEVRGALPLAPHPQTHPRYLTRAACGPLAQVAMRYTRITAPGAGTGYTYRSRTPIAAEGAAAAAVCGRDTQATATLLAVGRGLRPSADQDAVARCQAVASACMALDGIGWASWLGDEEAGHDPP
jgi:hypothetical protein